MSHVRGRIAVDVQFTDSTTSAGVQSLKTLTLQDATEYTTGKVMIVTQTVGTAAQNIPLAAYLDASGQNVTFSEPARVAFQCVGATAYFILSSAGTPVGAISQGGVAICDIPNGYTNPSLFRVLTSGGTGTYTLVLYGT